MKQVINEMLKENTGIALCDSGGENGRMWQRNASKTFDCNDRYTKDKYDISINVDFLINEHCEENETTKSLQDILNNIIDRCDYYMEAMEVFIEENCESDDYICNCKIDNTYNWSAPLSQVLRYSFFSYDDEEYIILQVHNGTDIRGGYTKPRVFKVDAEGFFFGMSDIYFTDKRGNDWSSQDSEGYSFCCEETGETLEYGEIVEKYGVDFDKNSN